MSIRYAYLCAFLLTALDVFLIPVVETLTYQDEVLVTLGCIAAAGTILSIILGGIAFPETSRRTIKIAAFWAAALPFVIGGLWWLMKVEPNVHGVSLPVFFLYLLVSELAALSFVITAAIRKRT